MSVEVYSLQAAARRHPGLSVERLRRLRREEYPAAEHPGLWGHDSVDLARLVRLLIDADPTLPPDVATDTTLHTYASFAETHPELGISAQALRDRLFRSEAAHASEACKSWRRSYVRLGPRSPVVNAVEFFARLGFDVSPTGTPRGHVAKRQEIETALADAFPVALEGVRLDFSQPLDQQLIARCVPMVARRLHRMGFYLATETTP